MRVLIDTTYAERAPCSGTAVYTRMLCHELEHMDGVEVAPAVNCRRLPPAGGGLGSIRNLLADRRWTAFELPRLAKRAQADVIHHPLPAHAPMSRVPQVITVHDLAFERLPGLFDRRFRLYGHLAHQAAARRSAAVLCVSETTAADVRELWRVSPERTVVARLGAGQELGVEQPGEPAHFLYVGDDEPRKNVRTLVEAYAIYRRDAQTPLPLILAGSATASAAGIELRHRPGADELAALYAGALALVHPSRYEGFGLTPLEAMAAGVPVIAADAPGVREVCGDAARYADPLDPASFAHAMTELAGDPELRGRLAEQGHSRATSFSWADCARAHVDAYSLALERA